MSLRQIKRLEKQRCEGDSGSDSEDYPSTMLRPQQKRKVAKAKKAEKVAIPAAVASPLEKDETVGSTEATEVKAESTTNDSTVNSAPSKKPRKEKKQQRIRDEGDDDENEGWLEGDTGTGTEPKKTSGPNKKQVKAQQKEKKKKQDEDDEALLNAHITELHGKEAIDCFDEQNPDDDGAEGTSTTRLNPKKLKENVSAMELLTQCDREWLDPRMERIRAFGKAAVESVATAGGGDNPHGNIHVNQQQLMMRGGKRGPAPKFRDTPFATADTKTWPGFSALGLRLHKKGGGASYHTNATVFVVDDSSDDFKASQKNFERLVAQFGDVNSLIHLHQQQPYHVPTLLQLHSTLTTMGENMEAQGVLDMALYVVGYLFSTSTFSLTGGNAAVPRCLPYSEASNQFIFIVLHRGIHQALKKGCGRTALELTKFVLSLDETDPKHVLLCLDYCALRGSQFEWLVSFHDALEKEQSPLAALPSLHFNSALASFLLQQRTKAAAAASAGGNATDASSTATPTSTMTPQSRLCDALRLFPNAAIALGEKIGENPMGSQGAGPWADFLSTVEGYNGTDNDNALRHASDLFAERSHDVWKPAPVLNFLKQCLTIVAGDSDDQRLAAKQRRERHLASGILYRYTATTASDLLGEMGTAIPRELLQDEATAEEMRANRGLQMRQTLPPEMMEQLQRMEAAFGEMDPSLSLEERMALYEEQVEASMQRLGEEHSPLSLFMRTMMPWGTSARDLAVEQAMRDRGVEDPVPEARRRRREQQQVEEERLNAAAAAEDSDSDSVDE